MQWILSHTATNVRPAAPDWAHIHSKSNECFPTGGKGKGTDSVIKSYLNLLNQLTTSIAEPWPGSPARQVVTALPSSLGRHFPRFRWLFVRHIELFSPFFPWFTIHPGSSFISNTHMLHTATGNLQCDRLWGKKCAESVTISLAEQGMALVYHRILGKSQRTSVSLFVKGWEHQCTLVEYFISVKILASNAPWRMLLNAESIRPWFHIHYYRFMVQDVHSSTSSEMHSRVELSTVWQEMLPLVLMLEYKWQHLTQHKVLCVTWQWIFQKLKLNP